MTVNQAARVVIIGGGISGLSAAWYVQQQAREANLNVQYTLLEQSNRWGGKVLTEKVDGFGETPFVIEGGPDSFLTQKPWAAQLARELGIGDALQGTNDRMRKVYVLNGGKPTPLPDGVLLIIPTEFMPFALSPLISIPGKLRMGLDLFIPARKDDGDETLADFIRRRLGTEALYKIAEPLMSGIYNAEAEQQSLMATFPRFRKMEQEHGSLIRGMLASKRSAAAAKQGGKSSAFTSFNDGLQMLIDALVEQLTGDLRLNTSVEAIEPRANGTYRLRLNNGEALEADALIVTAPAFVASELLAPFAPDAAQQLAAIRYVSTGTISLGFRESDITRPLAGFGLVIPRTERRPINAVTLSSVKFEHRAPDGTVLLRAFFGGSRSPESMALTDEQLLETVRAELRDLLGISAPPLFHRIYRWMRANPQYDLNHLERVDAIEAALPQGVYVTGSAYRGPGLPDCIHQSQQTAARVVESLKARVVV